MLELVWGILNIAILLYFIIICFKAVKLVKENLGRIATLIFAIGIMSFISKPNEVENSNKRFEIRGDSKITNEESISGHILNQEIVLEKKLVSTIHATITFKEYNQEVRLLSGFTQMTGFVSGVDWITINTNVSKKSENTYNYRIQGTKNWRILGIKIYTEQKDFNGLMKL